MGLRDLIKRRDDHAGIVKDPTEGDRLVIEQLRAAGADLGQEREVRHYLYVPHREAADALAAIVVNEGHEAEVRESAEHGNVRPWLVLATSRTVVTEEGIEATRRRLEELAAEYGGEYDGWEAAV